ncbi:MAG: MBL fold metallo-hydrolase [Syntrophobacteraceae bacterium]
MIREQLVVGMLQTNCYILGDRANGVAVVIDPGGDKARIANRLQQLELELVAILNTHGHFDHVMDAWPLKEMAGGEIYLPAKDEYLLNDRMVGLAAVLGPAGGSGSKTNPVVDHSMKEGDVLTFGAIRLEVLDTPGHTPGHVSLYSPETESIFVGDTLFAGSIGRTDFPGGSFEQLIRSVRNKIFTLPGNTKVFPGHGPETTVEHEKRTNPFF